MLARPSAQALLFATAEEQQDELERTRLAAAASRLLSSLRHSRGRRLAIALGMWQACSAAAASEQRAREPGAAELTEQLSAVTAELRDRTAELSAQRSNNAARAEELSSLREEVGRARSADEHLVRRLEASLEETRRRLCAQLS